MSSGGHPEHHELSCSQLGSRLEPICRGMLREISYEGALRIEDQARSDALLSMMTSRVRLFGMTLDDPISHKAFTQGFALALVQVYIGIYTWLVAQLEDTINKTQDHVALFQARFILGETQSLPLLDALAEIFREAYELWDHVLADLLITSGMDFVTSNLLDTRSEFVRMRATAAGTSFPYYFRNMSGLSMSGLSHAYAIFTFPKALYPDLGCFLEALPDIALFINLINDVLSFYKEDLDGETANYIHNRAKREQKDPMVVVADVADELVACVLRVDAMLAGFEPYASAWAMNKRGHISMYTINKRYRLGEIGLGEPHPLCTASIT